MFLQSSSIRSTLTIILLMHSAYLVAQVNLEISPSRTSGVAPLYVFFDASSTTGLGGTNDLVNADFSWNFDLNNTDPSGDWEITKGMVAGHVFEAPGTYTVQCEVSHPDGTTDTETLTITATAFSGTTYYVSETGDDANDGLSESTPWQTANFAFSQLGADEQILFNRGDTFLDVNYQFQDLTSGAKIIGAYGSGADPILTVGLNGFGIKDLMELNNTQDMRIMDLHLVGNPNDTIRLINFQDSANHVLALRLELEASTFHCTTQDDGRALGIFDCNIHNSGVLSIYSGDSRQFSFVGNTIDSLIGTGPAGHGMRIQGGEKQFVAHNVFTRLIDTKTAITIRGDGQRHVMVYQNRMDRLLGVNPQNAQTIAAISHVTIEGNYIGQNPDYTGSSRENTMNGINIEATQIAIRNNIIDGYRNAINVSHDYNGVVSGMVDIYNNTANWRPVSPQSGTGGRMVRVRDVSDVNVRNNMISAPTLGQATVIAMDGTNTNIIVSDNITTDIPDYTANPLPGSAAHLNDATNYQLTSTSPAIEAGVNEVPVFYDQMNTIRPIGNLKDVGAFEYTAVLPVRMVQFRATKQESKILLQWQTTSELNNKGFFIERSGDGKQWQNIAFIEGEGTLTFTKNYSFLDENPFNGYSYYRLKQVDLDGSFKYSVVVSVNMNVDFSVNIYPNPIYDYVFIDGDLQHCSISVLRTDGRLIQSSSSLDTKSQMFDFSALNKGTYLIQIQHEKSGQSWVYKIVKQD